MVVIGEQREIDLSFRFDPNAIALGISEVETAKSHAVAATLCAGIIHHIAVHHSLIATEERSFLAIHIVFPRTFGSVVQMLVAAVETHGESDAAQFSTIVGKGSVEQHGTIGVDSVGEGVGDVAFPRGGNRNHSAAIGRLDLRNCIEVVEIGHLVSCNQLVVRNTGVGSFVLNPTEIVVLRSFAGINERLVFVAPRHELRGLVVEGHRQAVVAHRHLVVVVLHLEGRSGFGSCRTCGECRTLGEHKLLCGLHIARLCPVFIGSKTQLYIQMVVCLVVDGRFQGKRQMRHLLRCEGREIDFSTFHRHPVVQNAVMKRIAFERTEGIAVGHTELLLLLIVAEVDILVDLLEFGEFRCPFTLGSDDSVVHKVTLVWSGIVVAGGELSLALLEKLRVVDALIHPVPNATTDTDR